MLYTVVINIVISIVLLVTGLMNLFNMWIPNNAKKKLDGSSLKVWLKARGIGCLLASPVFMLIAYSQLKVISVWICILMFILMLIAGILVFGGNKKYLGNILGK